jgi:adenine-specific DNA-methyltransferase
MVRVVDGDDDGGISEAVGWSGGGGFRFLRVTPAAPPAAVDGQGR